MNYLPMMTEDEIRYICSVIPFKESVGYFNRYPNDFVKVMPGFRAKGIKNQEQASSTLFRGHSHDFISSFLEKHISRWLNEIGTAIYEKVKTGESKEAALLQTLPYSFFADNIELYFKLNGEEYTEELLLMLRANIKTVKGIITECEDLKSKLDTKITEVNHLGFELERIQNEQSKIIKKLSDSLDETKNLKQTIKNLEKSNEHINSQEQTIEKLKEKILEKESSIQRLKGELSNATNEQKKMNKKLNEQSVEIKMLKKANTELITSHEQAIENMREEVQIQSGIIQQLKFELSSAKSEQIQLEKKIKEEFAKQQEVEKYQQAAAQKLKCPKDLDEFKDYLGYNFENIGIPTNSDYYSLLKDYLSKILFQGKPIIITRSTGLSLIKCVSNTLVNTPLISSLTFTNEITEKEIDVFLSQNKRIVCLDNFIGNYNETVLVTICDRHRDKILFLTVTYDNTLYFVPNELMRYCHYLNLNRIEAFANGKELTEDPSVIDEIETENVSTVPDSRWSIVLREILEELGIHGSLLVYKSSLVVDELSFCRLLAFDVLPYCTDVLNINPFNVSERLVKYAGDSSRCQYKGLFKRWFT